MFESTLMMLTQFRIFCPVLRCRARPTPALMFHVAVRGGQPAREVNVAFPELLHNEAGQVANVSDEHVDLVVTEQEAEQHEDDVSVYFIHHLLIMNMDEHSFQNDSGCV